MKKSVKRTAGAIARKIPCLEISFETELLPPFATFYGCLFRVPEDDESRTEVLIFSAVVGRLICWFK